MKKFISAILTVALIISFVPGMTLTASASTESDFQYAIIAETFGTTNDVIISRYIGSGGDVVIPSTLGGYRVTSIRGAAFEGNTTVTSVVIPDSVTTIGGRAFRDCTSLTSVIIGNSVTSIGGQAFYGCTSLVSITIPNSVTEIGSLAFRGCSALTSVTIGSGVTTIEEGAFGHCESLTSITIGSGVTSIASDAFRNCGSLTIVTIPGNVKTIGGGAFYGCRSLTSVTLQEGVTTIGSAAFAENPKLTSVTIPRSVTSISSDAFRPNLSSLTLSPDLVIHCYENSYAHTYAKEYNVKFELIGGTTTPLAPSNTVNPTPSKVFVNGAEKSFEAYNIGGNNYFKLRDLAMVLNGTDKQFEVGYDNATRAITMTTGQPYTAVGGEMQAGDGRPKAANPTPSKIYIDGVELDFTVYNIGGNNFFKLRDLMSALDIAVTYDAATRNIGIDTSLPYTD